MLLEKLNDTEIKVLNRLPVTTWRWLNVNELKLKDFKFPRAKAYSKSYLSAPKAKGIVVEDIKNNLRIFDKVEERFNKENNYGVGEEFVLLAKKFSNTGALVHVTKNEKIEEPIRIKYDMDSENPVVIDNNIIVAEEGSEVTIIVEYDGNKYTEAFHDGLTRIYAKSGATVNLIKLQTMSDLSNHFDSNVAFIDYGAKVNYISVEIGALNGVTSYVSNLEDVESEANLKSIYLGDKKRNLDMSYIMKHKGRRSISNIYTQGVLLDEAKKIFRGTLDFKKGATRSKGSEEEYSILLSPKVKCNAVPILLCEEDDVEGQHAASAGKIQEDKLFYLMSRGFNEKEAKKLVIQAAFKPIVDLIPEKKLQDRIEDEIQRRLVNEG